MRLSEAIMAGSVLVRPYGGKLLFDWHDGKRGCALGMACEAAGVKLPAGFNQRSTAPIYDHWPWTKRLVSNSEVCCTQLPHCDVAAAITHIFDAHVEPLYPADNIRWTLEQLCDWIRSVEPSEPSEPVKTEPDHAQVGVKV